MATARNAAAAAEKRRLILDAAVRVFARQGFHTCRVSDIADEAGVAYGLVYHYFRSKDEVLDTLFLERWNVMLEAIREVDTQDITAKRKLEAIAGFIVDSYRHDPDLMKVIIVEVTRAANSFGQTHLAKITEAYDLIGGVVEKAQTSGEFRKDIPPQFAAMAFYGAIEQVLTGWIFDSLPQLAGGFDDAKRLIVETICSGLDQWTPARPGRVCWRCSRTTSSSASPGRGCSPRSARPRRSWRRASRPSPTAGSSTRTRRSDERRRGPHRPPGPSPPRPRPRRPRRRSSSRTSRAPDPAPEPTPTVGTADASFGAPAGSAAFGGTTAGGAVDPQPREARRRRVRGRARRRAVPEGAGQAEAPMTPPPERPAAAREPRPGDPGGLREGPDPGPRGDRARQGRGHREGHEARQGRGGRRGRRRSSCSPRW